MLLSLKSLKVLHSVLDVLEKRLLFHQLQLRLDKSLNLHIILFLAVGSVHILMHDNLLHHLLNKVIHHLHHHLLLNNLYKLFLKPMNLLIFFRKHYSYSRLLEHCLILLRLQLLTHLFL